MTNAPTAPRKPSRDERLQLLAGTLLFRGMEPAALGEVLDQAVTYRTGKGENLFEQGDPATVCYIVQEGRLKLQQVTDQGEQIVIRFMGPGDLVGCIAVFHKIPYPATSHAVADTLCLGWPAPRMSQLMERYPRIAANALNAAGGRIEELQARLREIATEQVEQRVARVLLRLIREGGRHTDGGVQIDFPISRQDIAEMTGATLHTVSRILSAWEQAGIVDGGRQRVVIREPHRLAAIAEEGRE